ncbi:small nuclear RNA activating complex, subunit SNAP43-domain-containing protein [Syncephalis fuscata]|nr:small nuclear RNA activating complex, subunit SNAP43-domain-containing protein [Syncephalis fuscata]
MTTNNYFSPYNRLNNAAATPLPEPTVPLGRTGIPARVMRKDIESLLIEFKKRDNLKLSTFAETWNELGWTYIHLACPNNDVQPLFMQGLYNTVFTMVLIALILREGPSYADRITAVYALYYLYFTQPPVKYAPTIRIRTSLRMTMAHIVGFLRQILDDSCDAVSAAVKEDVRYTLYRLRSEDAWDFVAVQTPPQWSGHRPEQDDMLQWEVILHDKVEEMEQQLPAVRTNMYLSE